MGISGIDRSRHPTDLRHRTLLLGPGYERVDELEH
jgi:hypothetical protein